MFSLSTSWNAHRHDKGAAIIDEIRSAGFDTVELSFALTESVTEEILAIRELAQISVSSLHNMCPLPREIPPERASPDYYSLSSLREEERTAAVKAAQNTLVYAKRFNARAVVLHAGRVDIKDRTRDLAAMIDDKKHFALFREEMVRQRRERSRGYLESVIKSLEELVPFAKTLGVAIGIENRYYYREIPIYEELETLFEKFGPGDLYYWHDVGHAEVFDRLGLVNHRQLLEHFSGRLIGIHLHDIIGPITDHQAPGSGTFDFSIIKPYIKPDTIKVLEVHAPASAEAIRQSAEKLAKILR